MGSQVTKYERNAQGSTKGTETEMRFRSGFNEFIDTYVERFESRNAFYTEICKTYAGWV